MANPYVLHSTSFSSPFLEIGYPSSAFTLHGDDAADPIDPVLHQQRMFSLQEPQTKTPYSTDLYMTTVASPSYTFQSVGVAPLPPPRYQTRVASPIESIDHSSAGGAGSPHADTDSHSDGAPKTPPEFDSLPSSGFGTYEPWSTDNHLYTGLGAGHRYVAMSDINSSQHDFSDTESGIEAFGGYSSYTSHCESTQIQNQSQNQLLAPDFDQMRCFSPDDDAQPSIKDEIEATPSQYPLPPATNGNQSDNESDSEPATRPIKRQTDRDDQEYQPNKRARSNLRSPAASRQPRKSANGARSLPANLATFEDGANNNINNNRSSHARQSITSTPRSRAKPPASSSTGTLSCPDCSSREFRSRADLDTHVKKRHKRPFICVFHFAGCESTFASKNEWKRHVSSQHLLLHYWLCQEGSCAKTSNGAPSHSQSHSWQAAPMPNGAIFNRKDLFTQHLKRMHMPAAVKKIANSSGGSAGGSGTKRTAPSAAAPTPTPASLASPADREAMAEWEERLRDLQTRGMRSRCRLPELMACPAPNCAASFRGADAWDQRMEHVARHLEKAAAGKEPQVVFGGAHDDTLVSWARDIGRVIVPGRERDWELSCPLKRGPGGNNVVVSAAMAPMMAAQPRRATVVEEEVVVAMEDGDEDAEGEEYSF